MSTQGFIDRARRIWSGAGRKLEGGDRVSAESPPLPHGPPAFFCPADSFQVEAEVMQRILAAVAPYTMVHPSGLEFLVNETVRLIRAEVPGVFVECGTWRGGSSLAMLLAQREVFGRVLRPVWMLDSFAGLPPVGERDGPLAQRWQDGAQPDKFLDNCTAPETEVRATLAAMGFTDAEAVVAPGWFSETLPRVTGQVAEARIALLRLDGDWYDSTLECLEALEPLVQEDGCVIVDDYYAWDGCARAVHDYLSRYDLPYRIKSLYGNFGMYFIKRAHRRSFEEF